MNESLNRDQRPDDHPAHLNTGWKSAPTGLPFLLMLILSAATFPCRSSRAGDPDSGTLDRVYGGILRDDFRIDSAASCGSAGCHGGPRPGVANPYATRSSEYQIWLENDPHANSWRTLCGEASVEMLERLDIIENGRIVDIQGFNNCLACHNSTPVESAADLDLGQGNLASFQPEGVACTNCHGPTERWGTSHYLKNWLPSDSLAEGFVPANDLLVRARMCASCHVGDRDRDMNHDIIAAGHPALRFEMATFHNRLPKHWRDSESKDPAKYETQLWAAGAIANADAWLSLMEGRANQTTAVSVWPELSAYDCSSCHHDLGLNNQRQPLSDPNRRGLAKQSQWNTFSLVQLLRNEPAGSQSSTQAAKVVRELDFVRTHLEANSIPDPELVAHYLTRTRKELADWSIPPGFQPYRPSGADPFVNSYGSGRLFSLVQKSTNNGAVVTWETASQYYLMSVASRHSWPVANRSELAIKANLMRRGLALPSGLNSPRFSLSYPTGPSATRSEIGDLVTEFTALLRER